MICTLDKNVEIRGANVTVVIPAGAKLERKADTAHRVQEATGHSVHGYFHLQSGLVLYLPDYLVAP